MNTDKYGRLLHEFSRRWSEIPGRPIPLEDLIAQVPAVSMDEARGALAVLATLGLVSFDRESVAVSSRNAGFVLRSLSELMSASVQAGGGVEDDEDGRRYLRAITAALEIDRRERLPDPRPLHARRIINVVLKGHETRGFRKTGVYLHVFHRKWNAYHLIGLGKKDVNRSDEQLATLAMEKKIALQPYQYELDSAVNPEEVSYTDISGSHGALTQYTIAAKVVRSLSVDINKHIRGLVQRGGEWNKGSFRWFTQSEIDNCVSDRGERIIQSTPRVLKAVDSVHIKDVAGKVKSYKARGGVRDWLGQRFTYQEILGYAVVLACSFILLFRTEWVTSLLSKPSQGLENVALLAKVAGGVASVLALLGIGKSVR